ncbi:MBL fold metallo-hydrolase [Jeotgalibacillus proteolyticus]|uniref:MBL fold metallo-hydrolase n=1 Tax=Jeotgalibacillus proteolyticus TaxID=2082395 RepID=A0A2S5GEJ0_9BACL|nr:MBL fold metallo-hydrolase [Jeotgalibacillus proteolyticus]PPA71331.1 MBL fold metallo-hydrolase [Jeotgalibacillus proteolyticus]
MVQWHNGIAQLTIPTPFAVGDVHVYVIKDEKNTLVDTGPKTKGAWKALKDQLAEIDLEPRDIDQIVLTHHHPDHSGLIEQFGRADILGFKEGERFLLREEAFMEYHDSFYETFFREMGLPQSYFVLIEKMREPLQALGKRGIDRELKAGGQLPYAHDWTVLPTPGHSQGHLSLYRKLDGMLIGGDLLLAKISSNPLIEPPFSVKQERPIPQLQYNESLKSLLAIPISSVLPGHGPIVLDAHSLISQRLAKQHERALHVKSLLAENPDTAFNLCVKLFPSVYRKQLGLTLSETMGQLDYLLAAGEIERSHKSGDAWIYKALTTAKEPLYEEEVNR